MLLTAPGVKLPSCRKNGFKASWWRCDEEVDQEADDKKNKVVLKEVGHVLSGKSNFAKEMKRSDGL